MVKKAVSREGTSQRDPTPKEWRALLAFVSDENPEVELSVRLLLMGTPSGQAFVAGAKRLRPGIDLGAPLDEITLTYDAAELLDRLLDELRCGTDPEFFIWKDIWRDASIGPSSLYDIVIEMASMREAEADDDVVRECLQRVRTAVERERSLERYYDWRVEIVRKLEL